MGYLECENCGGRYELQEGESPDDFESCECGGKLRYVPSPVTKVKKQGMITTNKILIVIIVILILGVGITIGMLLTSKAPVTNNTTDNTTLNVNNSVNNTTKSVNNEDNEDNYIGEAKAKQVAIDFLTDRGGMETISKMSVDFVTINGVPLYRVTYYDSYVTVYGTEAGWDEIYIGAKDGKIYDDSGYMVTT